LVVALVEMPCLGWKAAPAAGSAARVPHLQVPREADVPARAVEYWLCSLAATLTHG
jgi:hypothetical protein